MKNDTKIRQQFLEFFKSANHEHVKSSPLTPQDKTLLFTNSGMVQFKEYFAGTQESPYERAVTVQKCVRAGGKHNDLENVGYTNRHHTFFEMLGNFSFGDYFKEEAISFAWNFLVREIGIEKNRLYITVYHTDDESYKIWQKYVDKSRIIKIATNDNFWQVGNIGPCGPCSEIFYDYGDKIFGGLPGTQNQDGARYTEVWNLVFMQNFINEDGKIIDLPRKNIDTGMGLERLLAVMEGTVDNYSTTPFRDLILKIADATKIVPSKHIFTTGNFTQNDITLRILADHIRTISFLIADGVLPSNEGRGYVLRRIIRRALKNSYFSGVSKGFLPQIAEILRHEMSDTYPELNTARELIQVQVQIEEEKFMELLPKGIKVLEKEIATNITNGILSGELAFKLYDTYGFPLDITAEIAKKYGAESINENGFEKLMNAQQERGQYSWKGADVKKVDELRKEIAHLPKTKFLGYQATQCTAKVLYSKNGYLVLDRTVFYAEGGGQISDTGMAGIALVLDVQKIDDKFVHRISADLPYNEINLIVDVERRGSIAANHTATHLLHYVLRQKYGESLIQKGSLVKDDGFRFDFAYSKPIPLDEMHEIERMVNRMIIQNFEVLSTHCTQDDAKNRGAIALFGEKYEANVRVISVGASIELCGGIHVNSTGEIGFFKIVSQSSVASGVRRIEAKTKLDAVLYCQNLELEFYEAKTKFKINSKIDDFITELQNSEKSIKQQYKNLQLKIALEMSQYKLLAQDFDAAFKVVENFTGNLREIADSIHAENKIVFNNLEGNFSFCIIGKQAKSIAESLQTKVNIKFGGSESFVTGGGTGFFNFKILFNEEN